MKSYIAILALAAAAALSGCAGESKPAEINPMPHDNPKGPGLFSGESGDILDAFRGNKNDGDTTGGGLGVNAYLWRATLDAISFMPLVSADSQGGVIITDWYMSPAKKGERVKANVYILGKQLSPQALKVTLFKQEQRGNSWADVAVSPKTVAQLEETILTNARTLRVEAKASK